MISSEETNLNTNDFELDEESYNSILESLELVNNIERNIGNSSKDDKWFLTDIHDTVKLELNHYNHVFTEENIPCLIKQKFNDSYTSHQPNKPTSYDNNNKITFFSGNLNYLECSSKNLKGEFKITVYYQLPDEHKILFKFPKDFIHYPHYRYLFYAQASINDYFNNRKIWNVIVSRKYPVVVKSCNWSLQTWISLMTKIYEKKPLKYRLEHFKSDIYLPTECFQIEQYNENISLSWLYMNIIRKNIKLIIKYNVERMKDFKFFFFNEEIKQLSETWIPSKESLLGLNFDGLWVICNLFLQNGDITIKEKFFKYLFFRPEEEVTLFDGKTMNIKQLFSCESNTGIKWDFPTFSTKHQQNLHDHIFGKYQSNVRDNLIKEFRLMSSFELQKKPTDTCIYYSDITATLINETNKRGCKLTPEQLLDNLCNLESIKIIDHINEDDKSIVDISFYKRAQMMETALHNIFTRYFSNPKNNPREKIEKYSPRFYHYFADKRYLKNNFELSGEQEKALFYSEIFPITFVDGKAGSGKTAVMNRFINRFHKHEVLYISAVASTVQEVGYKNVTERSLTGSRCLILHNLFCLNNDNPAHLKKTLFMLNNNKVCVPPDFKWPEDEEIFKNCTYRCEQTQTCFNHCFIEKIRAIVFDELSMMDASNFCRLLYCFSKCAHPDTKYFFGGDGSQYPSISAGSIHNDMKLILNPFKLEFKLDHRFLGQDSIINMSNAKAIRDRDYDNIFFNLKTKFVQNSTCKYQKDAKPLTDDVRYHFIELNSQLKYATDDAAIEDMLKPTLIYLINQPEYLGRLKKYGESNDIHICCPTNQFKNIISKFICEHIFYKSVAESGRELNNLISNFGVKEDVFKGQKIIYKKNRYEDGIELYNNLIYIVVKIQDVQFKQKRSRKSKSEKPSILAESSSTEFKNNADSYDQELEDDLISQSGDGSFLLDSGGSLSVERTSREIKEEYERVRNGTAITYHEDLPTTACFYPRGIPRGSFCRVLTVVPAGDVDSFGSVITYDNQRIIPWTQNHIPFINRSTCTTTISSQGRQCTTIIGFFPSFWAERDINASLYVTATRAQHRVALVSTESILRNIVENPGKNRKTHFPNYIIPKIQKFLDHEWFKDIVIPEFIQKKLEQDEIKICRLNAEIDKFRESHQLNRKLIEERERKRKESKTSSTEIQAAEAIEQSAMNPAILKFCFGSKSLFNKISKRPVEEISPPPIQQPEESTEKQKDPDQDLYIPISKKPRGSLSVASDLPITQKQNPIQALMPPKPRKDNLRITNLTKFNNERFRKGMQNRKKFFH